MCLTTCGNKAKGNFLLYKAQGNFVGHVFQAITKLCIILGGCCYQALHYISGALTMCISVKYLSDSLIIKKFYTSSFESQYLIVLFFHLGHLLPSFKSETDSENFKRHNSYGPVRGKTEPHWFWFWLAEFNTRWVSVRVWFWLWTSSLVMVLLKPGPNRTIAIPTPSYEMSCINKCVNRCIYIFSLTKIGSIKRTRVV